MSDDDFEFDVSGAAPAAEKPKSRATKKQSSAAAGEDAAPEKVVKRQESDAQADAPQPKAEVSKPKESEAAPQTADAQAEEFFIPNTFDKLEAWIKDGKRLKFWLRVKAVSSLPFLLVLIIFIIIYSVSLGGADKKIDRLMAEKEQTAAQLAQDSVKIDELNTAIEKLNADVENLQKANDKLKKPTAAVQKKK